METVVDHGGTEVDYKERCVEKWSEVLCWREWANNWS